MRGDTLSLKFGKTEIARMVEAIDADHPSAEEAAKAALATAEAIFEKRAQFTVVGQVVRTKENGRVSPTHPDAVKVALGWYSTEGDAIKAAESLWSNAQTGDEFRCWVLPTFHGTPTELHAQQREKYAAAEAKRAETSRRKFLESIEKHRLAMEERAKGGKGSCVHCGHTPYDHAMKSEDNKGRGKCRLTNCTCSKWSEKTK